MVRFISKPWFPLASRSQSMTNKGRYFNYSITHCVCCPNGEPGSFPTQSYIYLTRVWIGYHKTSPSMSVCLQWIFIYWGNRERNVSIILYLVAWHSRSLSKGGSVGPRILEQTVSPHTPIWLLIFHHAENVNELSMTRSFSARSNGESESIQR